MTTNPWCEAPDPSAWMLTRRLAWTFRPNLPRTFTHGPTPLSVVRVRYTVAPRASSRALTRLATLNVRRCSAYRDRVVVPTVLHALRPLPTKTCLWIAVGCEAFPPLWPGSRAMTIPASGSGVVSVAWARWIRPVLVMHATASARDDQRWRSMPDDRSRRHQRGTSSQMSHAPTGRSRDDRARVASSRCSNRTCPSRRPSRSRPPSGSARSRRSRSSRRACGASRS